MHENTDDRHCVELKQQKTTAHFIVWSLSNINGSDQ